MIKKIKRHINVYLRGKHLAKRIKHERKGDCARCGSCCKIWYRCPFLDETIEGSSCKIYNFRPTVCRVFPAIKQDLEEVKCKCGFKFD